jgi:ribonuclease D
MLMPPNHTADPGKSENPILVYNRKGFAQMMTQLSRQTLVAVDTESDSLFRYYPKVCLIQLTTFADPATPDPALVVDYLVDPLRCDDIAPLELILANPAIEKTMHAAENDIFVLQRTYGFTFQNIFDTQLAARILGWKRLGLAAILEEQFGVISDKRMQRTDWGSRPLTPQQIAYAQMDTHYLPALRQRLYAELQRRQRWEEAQEAFALIQELRFAEREANERSFWQMKGVRELPSASLGVLAALWNWREQEAQRRDRPPFKVLNDEVLIRLAEQRPTTAAALRLVRGLSSQQAAAFGPALLRAIEQGAQTSPPSPPTPIIRPEQSLDADSARRFEALRHWRTRVAEARGVTPDIVFTNETLLAIARRRPQSEADLLTIPTIGPWKARHYGPELLAALRRIR